MPSDLKSKTISGVVWSSVQKFGTIIISFVSNMVLARLLTPEDYGCIGMLTIFITLSTVFVNGGFGMALIQKKNPTNEDYSTIFYWNILVSILLYIVLYFVAPFIGRFYNMELLSKILRVEGVVIIINSLQIVQENQLRKKLQFKTLATCYLISSVLSVIITIILALRGLGVWSLVAQQILMGSFNVIALWLSSTWKPIWCFSKKSFKELFSFGFFTLLADLVNTFCNNVQGLLIGKFFTPATMGYYSQAHKLDQIASNTLSTVINQVSYPVLSEKQDDNQSMIRVLRQFIGSLAYLTFPLMLLLIVLAKPIIMIVYSSKWLPAVPYFQILCVAGIANCLQGINYYAIAAIGKSAELLKWTFVKRGIGLILIVAGMMCWKMNGLLIGMVLTSYFIYFINAVIVSKHIGYSLKQQVGDMLPVVVLSVLSLLATLSVNYFHIDNVYIDGSLKLVVFVGLYLIGSILSRINSFVVSKDILLKLIHKNK